jgi:tripartite ATP-independent transporter DctM subunit
MFIIGLFIALLLLILLGIPIYLVIGIVVIAGYFLTPDLVMAIVPQRMFSTLDSFSLLALPYFILTGELMCRGGLSNKLVAFAEKIVGHLRGGLGQASVLSCMIFANITGSASASTSAIGSILIDPMKEKGYKPGFSAALFATSGIIGSIIPPSMVMIVYGAMAGVSIGGLFLAGIIPGLLIVIALMSTVYLHSFSDKFAELRNTFNKFSIKSVIKEIPRVWVAILAPVIILGGILGGIFTATEAGIVACVYSFIVSVFIYKTVKFKDLTRILVNAAVTTTIVVSIISIAGAFGWLLAYLDFNEAVLNALLSFTDNATLTLVILLVIMLTLTMFVESLAILIIMIPVITYIGSLYGFNPFYLGMAVIMATQIGATTPPVAVGLFVATSIAKTDYQQTLKYSTPFILALVVILLLIIVIPELSTWIPERFLDK